MQLTPRGALRAGALVAVLVAAVAVPGTSETQVYPGGCRTIDSMDADAWGDAVALIVRVDGEDLLESPYAQISAMQDGPGMSHEEDTWREIEIEGLLTAKIMNSRIDLRVDEDPLRAQAWSQATVVDLDILQGTIKADVIKGWANAEADTSHAFTRTVDSEIVGLHVGDLGTVQAAPGVQVDLPTVTNTVVGDGSFVRTYVREDDSSFPGNGSILYVGDTTVTMLHVYLANVPGFGSVEVIASKVHAHAEVPTPFCGLVQSVKAAAYVARARPQVDSSFSVLVGEQHIGVVGGKGQQQLLGVEVPVGETSLAEVNVTESRVFGNVTPNVHSEAFAMSKVLGLCIRQDGTVEEGQVEDYGECLVGATAIRAESNSFANASHQISWGSVTIVGLYVLGFDVCEELGMRDQNHVQGNNRTSTNVCKPPQDTMITIGPYTIWLNQRERDAAEEGHTGYYVRALRIQGPLIGDLIVSRAYTSADFTATGPGSDTETLTGAAP